MSHFLLSIIGFLELCLIFVLPIYLSYKMCKNRGRSTAKGIVVTLFTSWLGTLIIWLFLADKRKA